MSVAATAVTLLIGLPLAWLLSHRRFPGRDLLEALVVLPLILPPTVLGYYLLLLIGRQGPIGAALAAAGVPRGELHVTTKVWHENLAPDAIRRAFDASLNKLRLDHVDLYLVHWPSKSANWKAVKVAPGMPGTGVVVSTTVVRGCLAADCT